MSVSKVYKRQTLRTGACYLTNTKLIQKRSHGGKKERSSMSQRDLIKNSLTIGQVGEPALLMSFTHTWLHGQTHWNTQWCLLSFLQLASDIDTCDVLRYCRSTASHLPCPVFKPLKRTTPMILHILARINLTHFTWSHISVKFFFCFVFLN